MLCHLVNEKKQKQSAHACEKKYKINSPVSNKCFIEPQTRYKLDLIF